MNSDITGKIVPQAATHVMDISVSKEALLNKCNEYWASVKDRLPPEIEKKATKGGFRKIEQNRVVKAAGGPSVFYRPVLIDFLTLSLSNQERQILVFNEIEVEVHTKDLTIDTSTIKASVYLEPEVTWKSEVSLNVSIPKISKEATIKDAIDKEISHAQSIYKKLIPLSDPEITSALGHVLVLDCQTIIDEKVWAEGTFTNNKWLLDERTLKEPSILSHLIGVRNGQTVSFDVVLNDTFKEMSGKTAHLTARINQICETATPEINDDLAKSAGQPSLDVWMKDLTTKYEKQLEEVKNNMIENTLIKKMISEISLGPIPTTWLSNRSYDIYMQQRNKFKTEEDLLAEYAKEDSNIKTRSDIMNSIMSHIHDDLYVNLMLKSWGIKNNVPGYKSLAELTAYVSTVKQELLKRIIVEEVEQSPEVTTQKVGY
jgi:FKBP-type peptidyl-prolyl cis-trans isomerase (trigger factor)